MLTADFQKVLRIKGLGFAGLGIREAPGLWRRPRHLLSAGEHDALSPKSSGDAMSDNRRGTPRKDAFQVASLAAEAGSDAVECLVWDVSETGAQVEVATEVVVPDRFTLQV